MRWRRITGAICLDLAISSLFIWNIFVNALTQELSLALAEVNFVFAFGLAAFSAGVIGGGYLADRFAPRWLACGSGAGMVVGLWLAAAWPSLPGLVLGFGLLHGSAAGLGYATAVHQAGIINHGMALALVVSAYGAGSAILALPMGWLTEALSYRAAFLALSVFAAVICASAAYLLPGRRPWNRPSAARGSADSIGHISGLLALFWLMFGLGSAPGFIAFALAGTLGGATAYSAVIAVNIGNLGGRLLAGILSDRLGTNRVLHGNFAFLIVASGLLALVRNSWLTQIGLLMIGLQYGALSTLLPLSVRRYVPTRAFGRCFGIVFSSWGVGGLAAPTVASALLDSRGLAWVIAVMLVCGITSWAAMAAAMHKGNILHNTA